MAAVLTGNYRIRFRSVAKPHIKHVPALLAGSLRHGLDQMLIGNARRAVPVDLPVASQWPVGAL
jgi:hypothetical protein